MRIPKFFYGLIAAGAFVFTTQIADAAPSLRLTQGATVVTATDDDGDGLVVFNGAVGSFNANVSTGGSDPLLPNTGTKAWMDLSSFNVSGSNGRIKIELSDTGFTLDSIDWSSLLSTGGTTNGTVEAVRLFIGLDNALFSKDTLVVDLGPFSGGAFAGEGGLGLTGIDGEFSLTILVKILHGSGVKVTSFDAEGTVTAAVPTPGTLPLFLAGLVALGTGAYGARKSRRAAA